MNDYEPLPLSAWCNAGVELVAESAGVLGPQVFQGLPFLVGGHNPADVSTLIQLPPGAQPIRVAIERLAHHVVIAHRQLARADDQRPMLGAVVATYTFEVAGEAVVVPIRERFEIATIPAERPYEPTVSLYNAVPDTPAGSFPRYSGRWCDAGERPMEHFARPAHTWHLWSWTNPHPDRSIDWVEFAAVSAPVVIGAITLGLTAELPFSRDAKSEVVVEVLDAEIAARPFDLELSVDRGVATFPYPLTSLGEADRGWGAAANGSSSPAYAEIAASASATVSVRHGETALGAVRWGDVLDTGAVDDRAVRVRLVDRGRNWVTTRVVDDATGEPVPCRVHFRSPDGIPYQPHGHHNHVNSGLDSWNRDVGGDVRIGGVSYAYIDGTCEGWLPRGPVTIDVARGFEYDPVRSTVQIDPDQRELTVRLRRWIDMSKRGWYSGDSHVHFLSTQGALFEQRAEDLNVVNLLQSQWGSHFSNSEDWSTDVSGHGSYLTRVGQENRQHLLGHLSLWGLRRPVMPWCSDGPTEAELGGSLETTLAHWADECHDQGGTIILPHFPVPNGEPAALIATGRADGVEMLWQERWIHQEYYDYLNCGYRLPLVGGTDKMSADEPVGLYRTYARIVDGEFGYDSWRDAVVRGRTFLSGGPLLHLSVDGSEIGDTVTMTGPGTVDVEAWAESIFPIHTLQIVRGGEVLAESTAAAGSRRLSLREQVRVDGHTWIAARCGGPGYWESQRHFSVSNRGIFAHTSPVYVACAGEWNMFDQEVAERMLHLVDGGLTHVRSRAPGHRPGTVTHRHTEADHAAYLARPFHEAAEALTARLHAPR